MAQWTIQAGRQGQEDAPRFPTRRAAVLWFVRAMDPDLRLGQSDDFVMTHWPWMRRTNNARAVRV